MHRKHQQSIYHAIVNVNLMVQSVIRIKSGIMTNFHAIAKTSYM